MKFMDAAEKTIGEEKQLTENGASGYRTTGKKLLDLNFSASGMRSWPDKRIENAFAKAYYEQPLLAMKWMFYLRDVRGNGLGERRTFRVCLKWLAGSHPELAAHLIPLIPLYGRFDDLLCLLDTAQRHCVSELIKTQLAEDEKAKKCNRPVSLLAKWLPSANASSEKTKRYADILMEELHLKEVDYRKQLSGLRRYLDVTEVKMSAGEWDAITYAAIPSRANLRYRNAFLKHDEKRRKAYLEALKCGTEKIQAKALFPSDIVYQYSPLVKRGRKQLMASDETLEQLWKALPDYTKGSSGRNADTLVIRDGSGSMLRTIGRTGMSALDVSTALAVYFAEHGKGQFHNKFITFSSHPELVDMQNAYTLHDKLELCYQYDDCTNTDIEAVFDLILKTAVSANMCQDELPENVLIVSDMEFDVATVNFSGAKDPALFESIAQKFEAAGYKMPRLVFWNVCSRTNTIPVKENELGIVLVSGFHPAVYAMVLSNLLDPYECLLEQLNTPRYQPIEAAIKDYL